MPPAHWPSILSIIVSVFLVVGAGMAMRRLGWLTAEADQSLLKLVVRVLIPCLIFRVVVDNPSLRHPENLILPPLLGFGLCAAGVLGALAVARLGARLTGLHSARQRRTFAACVGIFNYGFVPIPLIQRMFDDSTLGVLFVHNVGVELAIWTVGLLVLTGSVGSDWWRRVLNPPSIAIVIAAGLNLLGGRALVPAPAMEAITLLSHAAIPTALLLVGATIADELRAGPNAFTTAQSAKIIAWALGLRLLLLPAGFVALALLLPTGIELKRVLVIEAGQASAVFPIVMARHYHGHPGTAMRVVLSTSLASLATMPLWIILGLALLG